MAVNLWSQFSLLYKKGVGAVLLSILESRALALPHHTG